MFGQTTRLVAVAFVLTVAMLLSAPAGYAAEIEGAGTWAGDAMAPTAGWVSIEPGEAHWYTFNYDFDEEDGVKQVVATLEMASPGTVGFEVWTHDLLRPYTDIEDEPDPLGVGSLLFKGTDDDGDTLYNPHFLVWQGGSKESADYFVVVEGDGEYLLSVTGDTVNFKEAAVNATNLSASMK